MVKGRKDYEVSHCNSMGNFTNLEGKFPNIIASDISQTIFTLYLMGIICITNTCDTMGKGLPFSIVTNGMR